jgi:hypothetical protein
MQAEKSLVVENWQNIREGAERKLAQLLRDLAAHVDYYGVVGFQKQLIEYAEGNRSSNIGDGMVVTLGGIRSALEDQYKYFELCNVETKAKREAEDLASSKSKIKKSTARWDEFAATGKMPPIS